MDAVLSKYAGKEEQLIALLVQRLGPEPVARHPKVRVEALLSMYAPDKLSTLDEMLLKYKNREVALIDTLISKLGPEPLVGKGGRTETGGEGTNSRLLRFLSHYTKSQDNAATADALMKRYKGREKELFANLVSKYGPEPLLGANKLDETSSPPTSSSLDEGTHSNTPQDTQPPSLSPRNVNNNTTSSSSAIVDRLKQLVGSKGWMAILRNCRCSVSFNNTTVLDRIARLVLVLEYCCFATPPTSTPQQILVDCFGSFPLSTRGEDEVSTYRAASALHLLITEERTRYQTIMEEFESGVERVHQVAGKDRIRISSLLDQRHAHQAAVVARAMDLVDSVERSSRGEVVQLQEITKQGLHLWFREQLRFLLVEYSPQLSILEKKFTSWKTSLKEHAADTSMWAKELERSTSLNVHSPSTMLPGPSFSSPRSPDSPNWSNNGTPRKSIRQLIGGKNPRKNPISSAVVRESTERRQSLRAVTPEGVRKQLLMERAAADVIARRLLLSDDVKKGKGLPAKVLLPTTTPMEFRLSR